MEYKQLERVCSIYDRTGIKGRMEVSVAVAGWSDITGHNVFIIQRIITCLILDNHSSGPDKAGSRTWPHETVHSQQYQMYEIGASSDSGPVCEEYSD